MNWLNLCKLLLALLSSAVIGAAIGAIVGAAVAKWARREAVWLAERMEKYGISLCGISLCGGESGGADCAASGGRVQALEEGGAESAGEQVSDLAGGEADHEEGAAVQQLTVDS